MGSKDAASRSPCVLGKAGWAWLGGTPGWSLWLEQPHLFTQQALAILSHSLCVTVRRRAGSTGVGAGAQAAALGPEGPCALFSGLGSASVSMNVPGLLFPIIRSSLTRHDSNCSSGRS